MVDRLILERLIKEGDSLKRYIRLSEGHTEYMIGAEYNTWVSKCTLFLETNYSNSSLTKKFIYASSNNTIENYEAMLKILKAIEGLEASKAPLAPDYGKALG